MTQGSLSTSCERRPIPSSISCRGGSESRGNAYVETNTPNSESPRPLPLDRDGACSSGRHGPGAPNPEMRTHPTILRELLGHGRRPQYRRHDGRRGSRRQQPLLRRYGLCRAAGSLRPCSPVMHREGSGAFGAYHRVRRDRGRPTAANRFRDRRH